MKASTIFINILSLASLFLVVSCNEEEQHGQTVCTILATIEQSSTRTALDDPDADGVYKTIWSSDDAIAVFSGNNAASEFKLTSGANTNTAEFEGNAASDNMVAIYPYSIVKGRTGSTISVTLPEVQEYVSGNIPQGSYPMAAVSDGAVLPFYNLCSVLRLRMFGDLTVNSITFTPNDASTKASGNATVNAADKMLTMSSNAKSTVKLNCANGVKLTRTSTDFLMVVPAQKYTGGFTITISTDQGDVVKAVKSDVTLSRSVLYPIKPFECILDNNRNIVFEDANFKAYLVANFDKNGDGEISRLEALDITRIEVCTDNITSLAGIESMPNLKILICGGTYNYNIDKAYGKLKVLDVSQNTLLDSLDCSNNIISTINLEHNQKLTVLDLTRNELTTLDASKCTKLVNFYCGYNKLTKIIMPHSTEMKVFICRGNKLESVDISANTKLLGISCDYNKIRSLDISLNPNLRTITCDGNRIETLNVSHLKILLHLSCERNNINSIDLTNNPYLEYLYCNYNSIETLDITKNTSLRQILCKGNHLKSLDVSENKNLNCIECDSNNIETLDISQNPKLNRLCCQNNPLKTLYVYKDQIKSIYFVNIPDFTQIIENVINGGNDDTKTGDIIYLD